jgi:hypothetical protein
MGGEGKAGNAYTKASFEEVWLKENGERGGESVVSGDISKIISGETAEVGEHIGAPPHLLADLIEEPVRGLDDRGRDGVVAGAREQVQQSAGLGLKGLELLCGLSGHGFTCTSKVSSSLPGSTGQSSNQCFHGRWRSVFTGFPPSRE